MKVSLKAVIYPTENSEKVSEAVKNIFPDLRLEVEKREGYSIIKGKAEERKALEKLYKMLRKEKILDTARNTLMKVKQEDKVFFLINKQAAYVGRLNLSAESPLGAIEVEIEDGNIDAFIDWLAPETFEGREK
ncbi:MAG TPA: hypothetical protein ENH28_05415 [Euryarchaeota archaeon]|nr:hypothetical protein BMS3Bbin15_01797 [archaeon BMS3Bbin15]HDL15570.1 hypothetical protein [Euryarchaeota archaeon]